MSALLLPIRTALEAQGEVDDLPDWDQFAHAVRLEDVAPNVSIVQQGDADPYVRFVLKGLVRLSYEMANGARRTKSIISEGEAFASLNALGGGAATYAATALEPTTLACIPYARLQFLMERHHAWERIVRKVFATLALKKERREYELLTMSPAQRWAKFNRDHTSLLGRISQIEIAALIGITPVALSRLKGRVAKERLVSRPVSALSLKAHECDLCVEPVFALSNQI
jgi:CRP-like cAMP-binding protein